MEPRAIRVEIRQTNAGTVAGNLIPGNAAMRCRIAG